MKEQITIRLYETREQRACCGAQAYRAADDVVGWNYQRGDQIGLQDCNGGFLMGGIDHVDPTIHEDQTGRFRLATVWTQD